MKSCRTVNALLEKRLGISCEAVGPETLERAVHRQMRARGFQAEEGYLEYVERSSEGWEALMEEVVVPETWFFRNPEAFDFLARYVAKSWLPERADGLLRILSAPCASGEEPYSIVMALLERGFAPGRIQIDAVDISSRAIEKARCGLYGRESFRGTRSENYRERYFDPVEDRWRLSPEVMAPVRFIQGNILERGLPVDRAPYDFIFCRNLLIYLNDEAKRSIVDEMGRLLAPRGILFSGHVETTAFLENGFEKVPGHSIFACRRPLAVPGASRAGTPPVPREDAACQGAPIHFDLTVGARAAVSLTVRPAPVPEPFRWAAPPATARVPEKTVAEAVVPPPGDVDPSGAESSFRRARVLADGGRLCDALEACVKTVSRDALHVPAHFLMGLIYEAMNRREEAGACFRKVLYLVPDHVDALEHMALLAEERGDAIQAERLKARARKNHSRGDRCTGSGE